VAELIASWRDLLAGAALLDERQDFALKRCQVRLRFLRVWLPQPTGARTLRRDERAQCVRPSSAPSKCAVEIRPHRLTRVQPEAAWMLLINSVRQFLSGQKFYQRIRFCDRSRCGIRPARKRSYAAATAAVGSWRAHLDRSAVHGLALPRCPLAAAKHQSYEPGAKKGK
jgi:hypothetical protein